MSRLAEYKLRPSPQLMMPWHPGVTVSTARAAELLGVSSSTVLRMLEEGTLEGFKLRRNKPNSPFRVIRDSILRVLEEWRREAGIPGTSVAPSTAGKAAART